MEFKEIISKRRSIRKFDGRPVPREVVDRMLAAALSAPSSRNSRSTRFLVVDDPAVVARMAGMRDYGAGFMKGAPLAVVVLGDTSATDLWRENCAIAATVLQLSCVDEGLASCWVHVDGRPRLKEAPDGETAADFLRTFLPIP
ncbi:MAG: nitroreductase family protein, partial [Alistipes sp.]|nr:nitroreductase family protein [Alistipes sp.]